MRWRRAEGFLFPISPHIYKSRPTAWIMGIKDLYFWLEDAYYGFLDHVQKVIPVYSLIDPIDRIIPSFAILLQDPPQ